MSLYPAAISRHPRLLGVFAHPDDEVFCAGGILAQWAAAGCETMVISATRGEAGQIEDAHAATRRTLGAVRERELRAACTRLGVRRVACLDYRDGALREVDAATLARDVASCIRSFGPEVVITFGPDGGYGHPDHIAISAATSRACQEVTRTGGYTSQLYYSAFPRQHRLLCEHLSRWLTQRGSRFRGSDAFVRALALVAGAATTLGYADDAVDVRWFPAGLSLIEQGEPATGLYLIVSGHAAIIHEDDRERRRLCRRLGPGEFFGEEALTGHRAQNASVVATETVTCLVLSTHAPTPYDGRGTDAHLDGVTGHSDAWQGDSEEPNGLICVDISAWLNRKIAALSAHRTQFRLGPARFPAPLLEEWLGREYFTRAELALRYRRHQSCESVHPDLDLRRRPGHRTPLASRGSRRVLSPCPVLASSGHR